MKRRSGELSSSSEASSRLPVDARALRCARISRQRSKHLNALKNMPFFDSLEPEAAVGDLRQQSIGGSARKPVRPMPQFNRLGRSGFPGKLAGASLKHVTEGAARVRREVFPRQTCRGLIEAPPGESISRVTGSGFPGKLAGASLKRAVRLTVEHDVTEFPRQTCRGLIEASLAARPRCGRRPGFPGKLAGASLKRSDDPHGVPDRPLVSPANLPGPH